MPVPVLHTDRLLLKEIELPDAAILYQIRSEEQVNRFIERAIPATIEDTENFICKIRNDIRKGDCFYWGIFIKPVIQLAGTVCLWNFSSCKTTAEIGYELAPFSQRKGLMSECLTEIIRFVFLHTTVVYLEAWTHRENQASIRLLEKHRFLLSNRKDPDHPHLLIFVLQKNRTQDSQ